MNNETLPKPYVDIMITYKKDSLSKTTITKRGFYSDILGYFSIPKGWANFNGKYLPSSFEGDSKHQTK